MVKKLKFLLFFFTILLVTDVKASPMNLPNPTRICVDSSSGSTQCSTTITNATWNNNTYFTNPNFRLGDYGSGGDIYSSYNFQWDNQEFCKGKSILIKGSIGGLFDFFGDNTNWNIKGYNNNSEMSCSFSPLNSTFMNFTCSGIGGGSMLFTVNQESFPTSKLYEIGFSRNVDVTCDVTNSDIISSNEQNTQNIINNNTQNTQDIINNQNSNTNQIIEDNQQNTQDIINNQNSNTEKEIESQKVCSSYDVSSVEINGKFLNSGGNESFNTSFGISSYIPINSSSSLIATESTNQSPYLCFYNFNKSLISCLNERYLTLNEPISIPQNASYVRFSFHLPRNSPQFTLCMNGNQALNNSITDLNDTLNDTSQPNTNEDINDMNDMVASYTPISDLITMPLTLINSYISGINSTCSPVNLGNLYGTDLVLPCINLEQRLGSNLWSIIDTFFCIFMCYNIGMLFITAYDGITSLRDDFDGLYQPRHADVGYQPKHGGGN